MDARACVCVCACACASCRIHGSLMLRATPTIHSYSPPTTSQGLTPAMLKERDATAIHMLRQAASNVGVRMHVMLGTVQLEYTCVGQLVKRGPHSLRVEFVTGNHEVDRFYHVSDIMDIDGSSASKTPVRWVGCCVRTGRGGGGCVGMRVPSSFLPSFLPSLGMLCCAVLV